MVDADDVSGDVEDAGAAGAGGCEDAVEVGEGQRDLLVEAAVGGVGPVGQARQLARGENEAGVAERGDVMGVAGGRAEDLDVAVGGQGRLLRAAGAVDAEGGFRAGVEPRGGDLPAAAHALAVAAVLDAGERALHRGDLALDQGALPLERLIVLHLPRLLGGIGVERLGEVVGDPPLAALQFGETGFEGGPGGGGVGHRRCSC